MTKKNYFITFGGPSNDLYEAVNRITKQARQTNLFDNIKGYTDNDLKSDFVFWNQHRDFIENNARGYGYWLWKPYLILKTLLEMNKNDVLLYCDSGCEINNKATNILSTFIDNVNQTEIIYSYAHSEMNYTKRDLLVFMNMDTEIYTYSRQNAATIVLFKNTENVLNLVQEWYAIASKYHFIDDSSSNIPNYETFKEHRHDQSIFSLLTKKYGFYCADFHPNWVDDFYNYAKYTSITQYWPIWDARNRNGKSIVDELENKHNNKNVCVGLCVYNNSFGLPYVLKNINKLSKVFESVTIIVCYDDSYDNSLQILLDYKTQQPCENIHIDIIQNQHLKTFSRTVNIANARNSILNKIRETYSYYKYFIMMDSNDYSCIGDLNVDVIEKVLIRENEWDSISFDREAGYYDTWALSYDPYIYSFFHFDNSRTVVEMMRKDFNSLLENAKMEDNDKLIPVYSAFNGFAIYKTSMFLNCSYSAHIDLKILPLKILKKEIELTGCEINKDFENDCEHRMFHMESIKKNGSKIMISLKSVFSKFPNPPHGLRGPA